VTARGSGGAARPRETPTHCPYCSLQCGITLSGPSSSPGGPITLTLQPQPDFPTNLGGLCAKGWSASSLLDHPDRLLSPLVRMTPGDRSSPFRTATWAEAYDRIVEAIEDTQARHGRDAVGCFGGGGLTNEKAYQFGKFARVALRTSQIDYNGRFCMSSAATAGNRAFGIDRGLPFPLSDIARAKAILLVGSNPADTMPPAMQHFDAGRAEGAVHIVVDPRKTATAAGATTHLAALPGTDMALANGMLHIAIRENLIDKAYIAARTTGFDAVKARVSAYWPDRVERITGVPVAAIRDAVRTLATAESAMILTARGAEQHRTGTDTAQAFINLALALGLPGKPFSGYGTITGQGNGQGGREHGQKADQLPGYRKLADPADRAHVAKVWGIDPAELPKPGKSAFEMLDAMGTEGGVRTLLVLASNIVVSAPDANRIRKRLESLDFLVVSDIFLSETAQLADVVLPTTQWAEEEGTMTNLEGRVLRRKKAVAPPKGVRDDLQMMAELAEMLGRGQYFSDDPKTVYDELRRASAGGIADYAGITYQRIEAEQGVFWPCPTEQHPGTPRLFAETFPTASGRAAFIPTDFKPPAEPTDRRYPYVLTTGRTAQQYQSGTQTRRVATLSHNDPTATIHPDLARRLGVAQDDIVQLETRRGVAAFRVGVDEGIRSDTIFVPFHYAGSSSANLLTDTALDPYSRMPAFKVCAANALRIGGPDDGHLLSAGLTTQPTVPGTPQLSRVPHYRRRNHQLRKDEYMASQNRFLQGIYVFTGAGIDKPAPIHPELVRIVPDGFVCQPLYFRGGNTSDELVTVILMRDGVPMRYFPIAAKGDVHVPLRVVEDVEGGTALELYIAAPDGLSGTVIVDLGMVEV
jgi:assimilatory nitrate reductase catalytic subunit